MINIFKKHWNGEYSLAVSYWGIGVILGVISVTLFSICSSYVDVYGESLTYTSWSILLLTLLMVGYQIWFVVGTWRSADKYSSQLQLKTNWGAFAKFGIVISCMQFAGMAQRDLYPSINSSYMFLLGGDSFPELKVELVDDGKTLKIDGFFGNGSYKKIKNTVDENISVKRLYLTSNGGRLKEVKLISNLMRQRHLDSYVENECLSFCTVVFLSGDKRYATPNSKLGFHSAKLIGAGDWNKIEMDVATVDLYKSLNLPNEFIKKILDTPFSEMWYPEFSYLLNSGVVNEITTGGDLFVTAKYLGKTKEEIVTYLKQVDLFRKIDIKFNGALEEMAVAALPLINANKSDSEIYTAMRIKAQPYLLKSVANSNEELRGKFSKFAVMQTQEVAKYGADFCIKYLQSQLDISKVLPQKMIQLELQLYEEGLDTPFVKPVNYSDANVNKMWDAIGSKVGYEKVNVITNLSIKNGDLTCAAMVDFYKAIDTLPHQQRDIAIYEMYK